MSIHIQRDDYLTGAVPPTGIVPDFLGQIYIDVSTTPKTVYHAVSSNPNTGWQAHPALEHTHESFEIVDLDSKIQDYLQENGVEAAVNSLLSRSNEWSGELNNFSGDLRVSGVKVLTEDSPIESLLDVDFSATPVNEAGLVLGWDGAKWVATKIQGASVTKSNHLTDVLTSPKLDGANSVSTGATMAPVGKHFEILLSSAGTGKYFQMGMNKTTNGLAPIALAIGDEITFGFDFEATKPVNVAIETYDTVSTTWIQVVKQFLPQTFGTRHIVTTTIPENTGGLRIRISSSSTHAIGDVIKFKQPRLQKGSEDMPFYDFDAYLNKETGIVNNLNSGAPDKALSAAQGMALKSLIENNYAEKGHIHTEYALAGHVHDNHLITSKTTPTELSGGLLFESVNVPIDVTTEAGDSFRISLSENTYDGARQHAIEMDGRDVALDMYIGAAGESAARVLTLNFDTVRIPSGRIQTDSENGRILFPSIKIENGNTQYVTNSSNREYGLHLNNSSIIGTNQIAFSHAVRTKADGLLFPRSSAGNAQPSDIGQYNYMYILDDALTTDAAFTSTKNYIELAGRRIFFSANEPGREARPGDILIKI